MNGTWDEGDAHTFALAPNDPNSAWGHANLHASIVKHEPTVQDWEEWNREVYAAPFYELLPTIMTTTTSMRAPYAYRPMPRRYYTFALRVVVRTRLDGVMQSEHFRSLPNWITPHGMYAGQYASEEAARDACITAVQRLVMKELLVYRGLS